MLPILSIKELDASDIKLKDLVTQLEKDLENSANKYVFKLLLSDKKVA